MKKSTAIVLLSIVALLSFSVGAFSANGTYKGFPTVNILVNGKPVNSDVPAIVMDGRTLLPVAAVANALGMVANYDKRTNTVTVNPIEVQDNMHKYRIQSNNLSLGGIHNCYLISGKYYVPLDALGSYQAERNGLEVRYKMPHTEFITVTAKEIDGRLYINPQDLRLSVELKDSVLWINQ